MKVAILNVHVTGDNKDYNGGFGTSWHIGTSVLSRILMLIRSRSEYFPLMSYGYIAAILKQNGHEVKYVENSIPKDADMILLHATLIRHSQELELLKRVREKTNAKIGIIGPFATVKPELFRTYADFIVLGEPEEVIQKINEHFIPCGLIKSNPVVDLDSLPYPDWSLFDYDKFGYGPLLYTRPFGFVISSRSCPYNCSYCPYKVFGTYRARNPIKVVNEIEHVVRQYKIRGLMFRDPMFSQNKKRIEIIAAELIKRRINIVWGCETRIDTLDREFVDLLYKSGLRAIKIGIESTSDAMLQKLGRKTIVKRHQEEIIRYCDKKGIKVAAFYILGLPDDTIDSIEDTVRYAKWLNTDFANFNICTPIPGTKFFEEFKHRLITEKWEEYDNAHAVYVHNNLTALQIRELREKAIIGYYFRPSYILKFILRWLKRRY